MDQVEFGHLRMTELDKLYSLLSEAEDCQDEFEYGGVLVSIEHSLKHLSHCHFMAVEAHKTGKWQATCPGSEE